MSGTAPVRLGIIGCGRMAERMYAPAIAASPRLSLGGVADPDPGRASSVASLGSTAGEEPATHAAAQDLVSSEALDAVVVASPAEFHLEGARAAAQAGLPSLVEKPPAADARGAEALAALAPAPLVAFNRRIILGAAVRESVPARGRFSIEASLSGRRKSWGAVMVREDALWSMGPHLVDLVSWLTGEEVVEVSCAVDEPGSAELELVTERSRCRMRSSTDSVYSERLAIEAPSGDVLAEHSIGGGLLDALAARLSRRPHPLADSVARQLESLADHVGGAGRGELATAPEGAAVMRVLEAARESARAGGDPRRPASAKDATE